MLKHCSLVACCGLLIACDPTPVERAPDQAAAPATSTAAPAATLPRKPAPQGAAAYIISPENGAAVTSPVQVVFGLRGAGVAPAGIANPNTGHHHLLIDAPAPALGLPIPADARHVHFGGGQTEASVALTPGTHTLQLLLGDELHVAHDPPLLSEVVTIEVR